MLRIARERTCALEARVEAMPDAEFADDRRSMTGMRWIETRGGKVWKEISVLAFIC